MGAASSACEGCFGSSEEHSESGSRIVFRPNKRHTIEPNNDGLYRAEKDPLDKEQDHSDDGHCQKEDAKQKRYNLSLEDFEIIRRLGKGSFGKVYLVQKKATKKLYALKALKKKDLMLKNLLKCTLNEKNILKDSEHPFVPQLKYSFQSKTNVYMVMDYCAGGDLSERLKEERKFDEKTVKFSAAEIILAIEYLHGKFNIIHRDIKPENILITCDGHLKITDFGLAKSTRRALSLCGTPEYLAPEIISGRSYGNEVDWWSVGCLIFQMMEGYPPFIHENKEKWVENILSRDPKLPTSFSEPLKDLIMKLLNKDPRLRLGVKGAEEVKRHAFFKGLDWNAVMAKKFPPFKPITARPEEPHHQKTTSNGSALEPPLTSLKSHNSDNFDFPQFTYAAKDALTDDGEIQIK